MFRWIPGSGLTFTAFRGNMAITTSTPSVPMGRKAVTVKTRTLRAGSELPFCVKRRLRKSKGGEQPIPARHILAITLVLVTLIFLVYAPVWNHDFVNFDDPDYVYQNPYVTAGLTWP